VIERIFAQAHNIIEFPEAGHLVPEFERNDIREIYVHSYRVIYQIHSEEIRLLTIIHGARLLEQLPPETST